MQSTGLADVMNPSELFLSNREEEVSGSVVVSSIEGTRPLLMEVQALVVPTHYGNPSQYGGWGGPTPDFFAHRSTE